jgi:uncharacterized repeat protein (TIGR03803 family)
MNFIFRYLLGIPMLMGLLAAEAGPITFTNYHSFYDSPGTGNTGGANPRSTLLLSGNSLYGTTVAGGANAAGTLFERSSPAPACRFRLENEEDFGRHGPLARTVPQCLATSPAAANVASAPFLPWQLVGVVVTPGRKTEARIESVYPCYP